MKHVTMGAAVAMTAAAILHVAPAQALNTRSFVSGIGSDSNNCTRPTPCRTFAFAYTQTAAGGEINTLDPAGYGTLTIAKSISIVSGLGEAGVLLPAGGTGITINAGANDVINLRGLVFEGAGAGLIGIQFNSGASLNIQNSVIRNVQNAGIVFVPNGSSKLFVSNTLVSDLTGVSGTGINIAPTSGSVIAVLNRADILRVGGTGVNAGANSTVTLRDSTIVGNTTGVNMSGGGVVVSYGNNAITNNGTNIFGGTIPEQGARGPAGPQGPAGPAQTIVGSYGICVTNLPNNTVEINVCGDASTAASQFSTLTSRVTTAEAAIAAHATDIALHNTQIAALQASVPPIEIAEFVAQSGGVVPPNSDIAFNTSITTTNITLNTPSSVNLAVAGRYQVLFAASVSEANAAFKLVLNGSDIATSVTGRVAGSTQIVGMSLVTTSTANSILSVRNHVGNALTLGQAGFTRMVITRLH